MGALPRRKSPSASDGAANARATGFGFTASMTVRFSNVISASSAAVPSMMRSSSYDKRSPAAT